MKILGLVGGLCLIATAATAGGEFGKVNEVHERYNRAAKAFGADSRMLLIRCMEDSGGACQYQVSGKMTGLAKGAKGSKSAADQIAIFYDADSEAPEFVVALGVAMAAWSPSADKSERGLALSKLVEAVTGDAPSEVVLDGTRFRLVKVKEKGMLILSMTKA